MAAKKKKLSTIEQVAAAKAAGTASHQHAAKSNAASKVQPKSKKEEPKKQYASTQKPSGSVVQTSKGLIDTKTGKTFGVLSQVPWQAATQGAKKEEQKTMVPTATGLPIEQSYDAQFTDEYFASNPRYQQLMNSDWNNAPARELAEHFDMIRKMQAGYDYRAKNKTADNRYSNSDDLFAANDTLNQGFSEIFLHDFFEKASEEDVRWLIGDMEKKVAEAGAGNYKTRTQQDLDTVNKMARERFSSFVNEDMSKTALDLANTSVKLNRATRKNAYDADILAEASSALEAMNSGQNAYDVVYYNDKLREALDFETLANDPAYEDETDLQDELRRRVNEMVTGGNADQTTYNEEVNALAAEKARLSQQLGQQQDQLRNVLAGENYMKLLEQAGFKYGGFKYREGVEDYNAYSQTENTSTGMYGEDVVTRGYEANKATLDQIVDDPQRVLSQNAKLETADAEAGYLAGLAANMTDDERYTYFGLRAQEDGERKAQEYFDWLTKNGLSERRAEAQEKKNAEFAEEHPIAASIGSVGSNLWSGIGGVASAIGGMFGMDVDENSPLFDATRSTQAVRQTVGNEIADKWDFELPVVGNVGSFLYNTTMSILDNVAAVGLAGGITGNAGSAAGKAFVQTVMSSSATANAMKEQLESGADPQMAAIQGVAAGAIEAITEKYSLDALFDDVAPDGFAKSLKYLARNMITEGTEEPASDFLNDVADVILNGDESEILQKYEYYTANGYTGGEAARKILAEAGMQYLQSAISGGISGSTMAGGNLAYQGAQQRSTDKSVGQQIIDNGNVTAVIRAGLSSGDANLEKISRKLMQKLETGEVDNASAETIAEVQLVAEETGMAANGEMRAEQRAAENAAAVQEAQNDAAAQAKEEARAEQRAINQANADAAAEAEPEVNAEAPKQQVRENAMAEKNAAAVNESQNEATQKAAAEKEQARAEQREIDAQKAKEKAEANKKIAEAFKGNERKLGLLYRKTLKALDVQIEGAQREDAVAAVQARLAQLGETVIEPVAEAIVAIAGDEKVTQAQKDLVEANTIRQGVLNDVTTGLVANWSSNVASSKTLSLGERRRELQGATTREISLPEAQTTGGEPGQKIKPVSIEQDVEADVQETMDARAAQLGDEAAAETMRSNYDGKQNVRAYTNAFQAAYDYGQNGVDKDSARKSMMTTGLTAEQFEAAYTAGMNADSTAAPVAASAKGGKFSFAGDLGSRQAGFDGNQRAAVNALRRIAQTGIVNIEVFESTADASGSYAEYENGSYDRETNTIRIDINAGRNTTTSLASYALLRTASHELTHFIKAQNTEGYRALRNFVATQLTSDGTTTFDGLVARKMEQQPDLSYADAVEEVVADGCEMMLKDSAAIQQLAQENKGLFHRIRRWITNFVRSVKHAFQGVDASSEEARLLKDAEGLQKLWDDALVKAGQNVQKAQNATAISKAEQTKIENDQGVDADVELKHSIRRNAEFMENARRRNAELGFVSDAVLSRAARDRQIIHDIFTDEKNLELLKLPPDIEGNTFISDSSYGGTEENTTVCIRSMAAQALMDLISQNLGRPLTVQDTLLISQEIAGLTDRPECYYCYVATDRRAYRQYLGNYLEQRDDVVKKYKAGADRKALYTEFLNGRKDTPNMRSRFNMWLNTIDNGGTLITGSDIASLNDLFAEIDTLGAKVKAKSATAAETSRYNQLKDATAYAQSASWAKKMKGYAAYNGHILKWSQKKVNDLNKHYGLRMYSFSDYSPAFVLENMQMITDAAVRGLNVLGYTKEMDFAEIFAPSGMNINISTFAYEQGGEVKEDYKQGASWERAKALREKHPNVGIVMVATSDNILKWAIEQDWVDVVIPYHLVRTGQDVAEYFGYKNYTSVSGDGKGLNFVKKKGAVTSISPVEHGNDLVAYANALRKHNLTPRFAEFLNGLQDYYDGKITAQQFREMNPNYMKLVNETRRSYTDTEPVQPKFNMKAAKESINQMIREGGYYQPVGGTIEAEFEIAGAVADKIRAKDGKKYSPRNMDARYKAAYEAGDEYSAREMVREAAIAAGYNPLKLYHGTNAFGFTKIDPSKADDGISFFASTDEMVSQTYVGSDARIRRLGGRDGITVDQLTNANGETLLPLLRKYFNESYELVGRDEVLELVKDEGVLIRKRIIPKVEELRKTKREQFEEWPLDAEKENAILKAYDGIIDTLNQLSRAKNYNQVDNLFDAYHDALADLRELDDSESSVVGYTIGEDLRQSAANMRRYLDGDLFKVDSEWSVEYLTSDQAINMLAPKVLNGIYELYGKTDNLLEIDGKGTIWNRLDGRSLLGKTYANTRDFAEYAKKMGFDGVHFKDVYDLGGEADYFAPSDIYTFFNPSDVKSADPFTFDDDGELIPLSERFQRTNEDIRFSKRLTKQERAMMHEKAGEIAAGKEAQFKKSRNGEYIFAIGNKLVYNDGKLGNPYVTKVVVINVGDETDTDAARQVIFKYEEGEYTGEQARRILTQSYGAGAVSGHDFGVRRPVRRENGLGKGRDGSAVPEGNKQQIKKSIRTNNLSDREILADTFADMAANENERKYIEQYREKIDELNKRQQRLNEVRAELREAMLTPGKRDMVRINQLKREANAIADLVNRADKRLLAFEKAKPLQDVLARERRKVEKKEAEKRQQAVANVRERRNATEIRHKIKAVLDDFNRRLKSPTEKRYIPANMVQLVIAAEEMVDTTSGREGEKAMAKIAAIQAMYDRYKGDSAFAYVHDEVISDMLKNLADVVGDKSIYQMNNRELTAVYDVLKALKKQVTEAVKLKAGDYAASIIEAGQEMTRETLEAKPLAKGKMGEMLNWQLTPDKFFARLAGYKKNSMWSHVAETFSKGTEKMYEIQRDHYYHFREFTEAKDFDTLQDTKKLVDIGLVDAEGNPVLITRGMMLSVYMHLSSEDNARGFMYGGFSVPNLKNYYNGKVAESYGIGSVNSRGTAAELAEIAEAMRDPDLTDEQREALEKRYEAAVARGETQLDNMRRKIEGMLTGYEKRLISAVHAWNDGKSRDYINEVTMDLYGIKKAGVENYYPIHRDTAFVNTDFASISRNVNLENWGSLKDRVASQAPILLTDIAFEMDSALNSMSRYVGYARAQRDFNKLYNVRMPGMVGSVKKAVSTKFGSGARYMGVTGEQYIENYIGDITGSRQGESSLLTAIRRNLPRATMTLNLRVGFSQLSAIPKAAAEVGWGNMARGFAEGGMKAIFSKQAREELARENVWFWQRWRGEGGQREFADARGGKTAIDRAWQKVDDATKGWLLNWCQNFDVMSTVSMWKMAEAWAKQNTRHAPGSQQFKDAVNRKYTEIIRNTQAMSSTTERSDLARSKREGDFIFTMYKSEAFANFNLLYDAIATLRKYNSDLKNGTNDVTAADVTKAKKHLASAATSVVIGAGLGNALLRLLINAVMHSMNDYRDDEDEVTLESTMTEIANEVAGDVAGMVVFGSDIYDFLSAKILGDTYWGISDSAISEVAEAIDQLGELGSYIGDEEKTLADWQKAGGKLMMSISNMMGIPTNNAKRYVTMVQNHIADISNGEFLSFEAGAKRSNGTNYSRLLTASMTGDTQKWDRAWKELTDKGIEEKTIREGYRDKVKDAYQDGEIDRVTALSLVQENGGQDENEAYWTLKKWDYTGDGNFNKYTDLRTALAEADSGAAMEAYRELVEHGVKEETVAGELSSLYNSGEATNILNLQIRSDRLYTSTLKLKADGEKHPDDFDDFITAIVNGNGIANEISKLKSKGYTVKQCMSAINGAFGKSGDRYRVLEKYNPREASILLDRILDAYEALGLDREDEITWINENWTMDDDE